MTLVSREAHISREGMHNVFHIVHGTSRACCHKGWPFRQERLAASTGMTGITGTISCETLSNFRGLGYGSEIAEVANLSDNASLES